MFRELYWAKFALLMLFVKSVRDEVKVKMLAFHHFHVESRFPSISAAETSTLADSHARYWQVRK